MKQLIIRFAIGIFSISLFTSCAFNPVSGKKQIMLISEEQEMAMGREADPQIIQEFGLYPDSSLQRYINMQGQAMAKISHRPDIAYHFRILDSDAINAFAVPGGYVYFTRGIMAYFNNEAQFAGVLGHEIGHITARHGVAQQTNKTLAQLGLMVAVISDQRLAQFAETANQGLQLMFLKYGRDDERQSDDLGVQYSSKTGYDAHQMAEFFLTLQREDATKATSPLPEFLSTHPDPGDRYNTVNKLATQYQQTNNLTNLKTNRNSYLRMIDNMVYGQDPRQGFMEAGVFYHPEMRFQFNTPPSWIYSNTPSQVTFAPKDGSAVFFLRTAKGNTPEEAAKIFAEQAQLKITDARNAQVNGLPAYAIMGDQLAQAQNGQTVPAVRAVLYFIRYNNMIFQMAGACAPENFQKHSSNFQTYMNSFKQLTDASKINMKPERISLKTINRTTTLQQALSSYSVPSSRYEEMAILNGMKLSDQITGGSIIKIIEK
jgi:predicted Zn-dependent protease